MDEKTIIESTFYDSYVAYRNTTAVDSDNISTSSEIEIESGKCALSQNNNRGANYKTSEGSAVTNATYKLFLPSSTQIIPGDKIIITSMAQEHKILCGKPFKYPSHTEVEVYFNELS